MPQAIKEVTRKEKFKKDYKKLSPDIRKHVDSAITDLLKNPIPKHLRFNKLNGFSNPFLYAIHITGNHSHKITLEIKNNTAVLRRIGTHKVIDRSP